MALLSCIWGYLWKNIMSLRYFIMDGCNVFEDEGIRHGQIKCDLWRGTLIYQIISGLLKLVFVSACCDRGQVMIYHNTWYTIITIRDTPNYANLPHHLAMITCVVCNVVCRSSSGRRRNMGKLQDMQIQSSQSRLQCLFVIVKRIYFLMKFLSSGIFDAVGWLYKWKSFIWLIVFFGWRQN